MLQDMILMSVNEAMRMADDDAAETMNRITGGLNLNGLGL
jgi:DNA-binding protein YbaB